MIELETGLFCFPGYFYNPKFSRSCSIRVIPHAAGSSISLQEEAVGVYLKKICAGRLHDRKEKLNNTRTGAEKVSHKITINTLVHERNFSLTQLTKVKDTGVY